MARALLLLIDRSSGSCFAVLLSQRLMLSAVVEPAAHHDCLVLLLSQRLILSAVVEPAGLMPQSQLSQRLVPASLFSAEPAARALLLESQRFVLCCC